MAIQSGDGRVPDDRAALPGSGVVVYETSDGEARVDVRLDRETVRLTQRQKAEVFQTSTANIDLHLKTFSRTMS